MSGGLFGGYNKLQNAVYSRIDEANAIRLEKAAREYSDYMKNAYRLMNDPNLREIAERRIGDTMIPSAMRTASRETGEMNFGNVLGEKSGTVSAEQMYGVKLSQENKNEDFAEWAEKEDAKKVTNGQQIEENASYSRKIDNFESLSEGGYIPVGRVLKGSALNNIGLASTNIYFDKSKIVKSLDEHSDHITKEILKQIPQILNEPIVITEANADNTANVFGNVYIGSSPLMVGIMVTKSRDGKTEINKIRTVHARRDAGKKITDSSVLYLNLNIEKTQTWFQALGNDVPLGGTKFGFIRRITDKLKKVNSENKAAKGTELKIKKEPVSQVTHGRQLPNGVNETDSNGDVPSPNANIPQNGNSVNTPDAENSAAKVQQNSENAAQTQQRKPGTVSAEQMYGVKLSQENKNEDFAEWAEKEDAKKKKAAEKEATLAEKQKNADNSNLTNREKYSLSEQEVTEIKKGVSVITDADNNTIIDIKSNILENIPKEDWLARVKNVIRSAFSKGFSINGEHVDVSAKSRSEFTNSKDSAYLRDNESEIYADKMKTAPHLDVISQNVNYENEAANHDRTDNITSFDRGKVELRIGGNEYSAEVIIGVREDGSKVFYDIVGMDANKKAAPIGSQSAQTANTEAQEPSDNISSNDSITDTSENFKSKSENSAAKVQQAETEEEARLRTLYESAVESPADEAYDGADDVQKFIDDVKKRREDAGISDEDLKGMSKDRQKNVLSERAERAGLDMDAEGLVDFAQSIGKVKGFYGTEFKDFARVFDDVSSGNEKMRNELHKLLEVPHREAQRRYTESYKNAVKAISDKFIIPSTFLFMPQNPFRHIPNRLLDGAWVVAEAPCGGLVAEHAV